MQKIEKLRAELKALELDALLVTNLYNLRYLANFTGTTAVAIVTAEQAVFITDFRYTKQATNQAGNAGFTIRINQQEIFREVNDFLRENQIQKVGIEADNMNVSTFLRLQDLFEAEIQATQGVIEKLRLVKTPEEIAIIRKACEITDQSFQHILGFIQAGKTTEIEVANELERYLKTLGASGMSFETIVASGERSAMPHGVASDKVIEDGDIVTLDYGCYYQGYVSDMTRTIAVGSIQPELKEIYQIVYDAQALVSRSAKPGMTGAEMDKIARDYITEKGYGQYFGHSLGHGIGLEVHEGPAVSARAVELAITPGMTITNEPGIYIEGLGGVRIEDDLIVTEDGVEVINQSPRELIII